MEEIFFNESGVLVTNTRFVVGSQTFAMRNITSVQAVKYPPSRSGPVGLLVGSLLLAGIMFALREYMIGGLMLIPIAPSIFWLLRQRPTFGVFLATSAGEVRAIEHKDWPLIDAIVVALNQAIISHS